MLNIIELRGIKSNAEANDHHRHHLCFFFFSFEDPPKHDTKSCPISYYYEAFRVSKRLSICCPVSGYPPPIITWKKNGIRLQTGIKNVKKILAVINATYAVAKRKPEKIRLAGIRTLTSAIPVQRSNQLSYQANWELVIKLVRNIPGKDEDEIMNQFNDQLPVGLIAQLVRALYRYRRGQGSNPGKPA